MNTAKVNATPSEIGEAYKINAGIDELIEATIKEDKENLIAFANQITEIELPELQTVEGIQIAKIADALLRDCVTEIMAGIEAL